MTSELSSAARRRVIALIELLVILLIVILAIAIGGVALQQAREKARRAGCMENLRQLALASQSYVGVHGCLPGGSYDSSTHPHNFSVFVRLLPHLGQVPLYNAANLGLAHVDVENATIGTVAINTLLCPDDTAAYTSEPMHYSGNSNSPTQVLPGAWPQQFCSYAGNAGTWDLDVDPRSQNYLTRKACMNGTIFGMSAIAPADITDGAGTTFLFAERAHGVLGVPQIASRLNTWTGTALAEYHFWQSGETADAMFESWTPPNWHRIAVGSMRYETLHYLAANASSLHSGGAHFAFCDGSVKFITETIDSWKINHRNVPSGIRYDQRAGSWSFSKATRVGIYQALSTRDRAEDLRGVAY